MLIQNTNPMVVAPDQEKVRQPIEFQGDEGAWRGTCDRLVNLIRVSSRMKPAVNSDSAATWWMSRFNAACRGGGLRERETGAHPQHGPGDRAGIRRRNRRPERHSDERAHHARRNRRLWPTPSGSIAVAPWAPSGPLTTTVKGWLRCNGRGPRLACYSLPIFCFCRHLNEATKVAPV